MTKTRNSRETRKPPGNLFKAVAATVSLMAAAVPVIGAFEHWFSGGETSGPPATSTDYAKVCNLWNERHYDRDSQLAQFRAAFAHARDLTGARDALLLSTEQDIATRSELQNAIEALTPAPSSASGQRRLEGDWETNLADLRKYRERLAAGVASAAQLARIVASFPASTIEANSADARGQLLRLGASGCSLAQEHEPPIAHWPPTLLAALRKKPWVLPSVEHGRPGPSPSVALAAVHPHEEAAPPEARQLIPSKPFGPTPTVIGPTAQEDPRVQTYPRGATGAATIPSGVGASTTTGP